MILHYSLWGVLLFFYFPCLPKLFNQFRADLACSKSNYDTAEPLLNKMLVDNPHNSTALYNAGELAYQKKNFESSHAYFTKSIENLKRSQEKQLLIQATYQAGNSSAQLKEYKRALEEFRAVMSLDPSHEYAQKMIEQLERMLAQEEKNKEKESADPQQQEKQSDQDTSDKKENNGQQPNKKDAGAMDKQEQNSSDKNQEESGPSNDKEKGEDQGADKPNHEPKDTQEKEKEQENHPQKSQPSSTSTPQEPHSTPQSSSDTTNASIPQHSGSSTPQLSKNDFQPPSDPQERLFYLAQKADEEATRSFMIQHSSPLAKGTDAKNSW